MVVSARRKLRPEPQRPLTPSALMTPSRSALNGGSAARDVTDGDHDVTLNGTGEASNDVTALDTSSDVTALDDDSACEDADSADESSVEDGGNGEDKKAAEEVKSFRKTYCNIM